MAFDLNKILLIGNVGRDPELRFTPGGAAVTRFSLAVNRMRGGGGEGGERGQEETEWFTIVAWNKLAETCNQFVNKGKRVFVEGRLELRTYDGRDGQKHFDLQVTASNVLFLDRGTRSFGDGGAPMGDDDDGIDPEELPF